VTEDTEWLAIEIEALLKGFGIEQDEAHDEASIASAIATAIADQIKHTWLTREEVGQRLKLPPKSLAQWASQQKGPPFTRFGRWTRYRLSDVVAWEARQTKGGGPRSVVTGGNAA
jgi:hypothetical protein